MHCTLCILLLTCNYDTFCLPAVNCHSLFQTHSLHLFNCHLNSFSISHVALEPYFLYVFGARWSLCCLSIFICCSKKFHWLLKYLSKQLKVEIVCYYFFGKLYCNLMFIYWSVSLAFINTYIECNMDCTWMDKMYCQLEYKSSFIELHTAVLF